MESYGNSLSIINKTKNPKLKLKSQVARLKSLNHKPLDSMNVKTERGAKEHGRKKRWYEMHGINKNETAIL